MSVLPEHLTLDYLAALHPAAPISLSAQAEARIRANRDYLERKIAGDETYYGINTGFGALCNVRISPGDLAQLQENLVRSHACGMGDAVPEAVVRTMLLLKIHGLSHGYSGVRVEVVQRLVDFYNRGIIPVVYELGSLGASGDLAPLAHLCLPLFGAGEVWKEERKVPAAEALRDAGLAPIPLAAKEGLALLNGTQFMSAYAVHSLVRARRLSRWADAVCALSADAYGCKSEPFRAPLHRVRPHPGQVKTAARILRLLEGSGLQANAKEQVQDPYSFRCAPQVHGASKDVFVGAVDVVERELHSVTDNPIVFEAEDAILSGGNFHGQPLALQLDFLAIALAELGSISERRTYLLVSGGRGLPPFLAPDAGLNSGFMIAQYTAAAIVSQNKGLCMPASVDTIPSSAGQEDHVSMGANAATKALRVARNVQRVLAIELLAACQALDLRRPGRSSDTLEALYARVRSCVPFTDRDRVLHDDLVAAEGLLEEEAFV